MEIFSLIFNVFRILKTNEKIYTYTLVIMVFISSFFEMFALSLILPLFQFLFDNELNENFKILHDFVIEFSNLVEIDSKIFFGLIVIFMLLIAFLIKISYIIMNERFAQLFSNRLVFEMFDKVFHSNFSWSRTQNSTQVIQRIINDCGSITQGTIATSAEFLYQLAFGLIGFISIVYLLDITALLYLILVIAFVIILIFIVSPIIKKITNVQRINQFKVLEDGVELFRSMRFLKSSRNELNASIITKKTYGKANKARRDLSIMVRGFPAIILLLGQVLIILLVLHLVFMPSQGSNEIINLSFVGLILARLLPSISAISSCYNRLVKLIPYYDGYKDLVKSLKNNYKLNRYENKNRPFYNWKSLKIENLTYKLNNKIILLKDISLELKRNKVYGLVGESGVGKTTLMDILSGLINPDKINFVIDNQNLNHIQKQSWLFEIGYASQDPIIFNKNIIENISLNSKDPISEQSIIEILKSVELEKLLNNKHKLLNYKFGEQGINLSGGQRQRVGIARAVFKKPTFLILDEATSGMDRLLENKIRKNVRKIESKPTIIIISHNVETLANCDSVIYFKNSSEIEVKTFSNLSKDKSFKKLLIKEKD